MIKYHPSKGLLAGLSANFLVLLGEMGLYCYMIHILAMALWWALHAKCLAVPLFLSLIFLICLAVLFYHILYNFLSFLLARLMIQFPQSKSYSVLHLEKKQKHEHARNP